MRNSVSLILIGFFLIASTILQAQTSSAGFGMHMHAGVLAHQPWPSVPIGSQRLWDAEVSWANINTGNGRYAWGKLDNWLNTAKAHGVVDVLYTFGRVPAWASSNPGDTSCSYSDGACAPPNDLNADGTGTNQHWKDFVKAIATHAAGRIKYWEMWNEPHNAWYWHGTFAQMVRMTKDARDIIKSIDPSAVILSPSPGVSSGTYRSWMTNFLAAGGGQYVDVIAFHGYIQKGGVYPIPEDIVPAVTAYKSILKSYNQSTKPLWDTEASWGRTSRNGFTNQDMQAGFLARFYLLHRSLGVARFYWYMWNNKDTGQLWKADPNNPSNPGTLLKPGIAYKQVRTWINGAQLTKPCAPAADGTWICLFTRADSTQVQPVWYPAGTKTYTAPSIFRRYSDVYGNVYAIPANGSVTVGYKPILLMP